MLRRPFSNTLWKPKNPHSLDYLKYLHQVLCKNQTVTESNCNLLVEALRMISEILIWGDQNDSAVIDFFLEKSMLAFFLRYMKQKSSKYICVQLLQTLNILFENISDKTSIYYLLSNNHINSIICHKFDFSDEEIMAYYISFLKTLSFKLNKHTIHFFYNELTNDFALYTEAIKFFNHSENMVRIAVRTITLNVYKVEDRAMLRYIRDKTAVPYFSNLVWFIGNHVLELDACVRNDAEHTSRGRLEDLVAEHLDHLHYLNDILALRIGALNDVLCDHLMNRLFLPLLVCSLPRLRFEKYTFLVPSSTSTDEEPYLSGGVALYLLTQVFLIIHHPALVRALAHIIFHGRTLSQAAVQDPPQFFLSNPSSHPPETTAPTADVESAAVLLSFESNGIGRHPHALHISRTNTPVRGLNSNKQWGFIAPDDSLAKMLESRRDKPRPGFVIDEDGSINRMRQAHSTEDLAHSSSLQNSNNIPMETMTSATTEPVMEPSEMPQQHTVLHSATIQPPGIVYDAVDMKNCTDEEKLAQQLTNQLCAGAATVGLLVTPRVTASEEGGHKIFFNSILHVLECRRDGDYEVLFAVCLLYAIYSNKGINPTALGPLFFSTKSDEELDKSQYNVLLMERLIGVVAQACKSDNRIRLVTLEMVVSLIKLIVLPSPPENGAEMSTYDLQALVSRDTSNGGTPVSFLQDRHLAYLEEAKEESLLMLRNHYKNDEMFLDQFEDEYYTMNSSRALNVEYLMMDATLLLQPTGTPLSGIQFTRRHACGETEKMRRAIRVFLHLRALSHRLRGEEDSELPLDKCMRNVELEDKLDLRNSDLIACTVVKDGKKERRFLVVEYEQMILVEPDSKRLGWGVVTFVGHLQHVEITPDSDDTRTLHVTVRRAPIPSGPPPTASPYRSQANAAPRNKIMSSVPFVFDDHIRCNAAKQRLTRGREKVLHQKMSKIARLLDLPANVYSMNPPALELPQPSTVAPNAYLFHYQRSPINGDKMLRYPTPAASNRGSSSSLVTNSSQSYQTAVSSTPPVSKEVTSKVNGKLDESDTSTEKSEFRATMEQSTEPSLHNAPTTTS